MNKLNVKIFILKIRFPIYNQQLKNNSQKSNFSKNKNVYKQLIHFEF